MPPADFMGKQASWGMVSWSLLGGGGDLVSILQDDSQGVAFRRGRRRTRQAGV